MLTEGKAGCAFEMMFMIYSIATRYAQQNNAMIAHTTQSCRSTCKLVALFVVLRIANHIVLPGIWDRRAGQERDTTLIAIGTFCGKPSTGRFREPFWWLYWYMVLMICLPTLPFLHASQGSHAY